MSPAEIHHAAERALVNEFADRLPDGYDTLVGEAGTLLSGGQQKRTALARVLLRNASILVLDEPTAGLDTESEETVLRAIADRDLTSGRQRDHRARPEATADVNGTFDPPPPGLSTQG